MNIHESLPILLGTAWLLPLVSFVLILFFGPKMGKAGKYAGHLAIAAIGTGLILSVIAACLWCGVHPAVAAAHGEDAAEIATATTPMAVCGDWYTLFRFGSLAVTVGYYIDALTIAMFCMVTLIATCIHVYATGYMHEELEPVTDAAAPLRNGSPLKRPGRYYRFFQYLSLFCFSMLGLVISGSLAMTFVFWELVGICSYFLIGFYRERESSAMAGNKAFIVNRVGDFGFLIGVMIFWSALGTLNFGDREIRSAPPVLEGVEGTDGTSEVIGVEKGIFSLLRGEATEENAGDHALVVPRGFVDLAKSAGAEDPEKTAYVLLFFAGLGIFCGCVGKSAQFPLHVWLPDAMEGPTPVSALVHSATMVAAGVFLVGRFYAALLPEVLFVIAVIGCITLFIAATIALTATDIKKVLAYSTISQLGYMFFGLGVGGWFAGMLHLFTHAFFKSLLFMGSGSVIHAVHTNEMPLMGGLFRKMPWTAVTMLIGCLAIAGAGIPLIVGLSGYYSKDAILAQGYSFMTYSNGSNPYGSLLFWIPTLGACMTAFYMFRLWYMTFLGKPREMHRYEHAHESPWCMVLPLVVTSVFAIGCAWTLPGIDGGLKELLIQAEPVGVAAGSQPGSELSVVMPAEELSHEHGIHVFVSWLAFGLAFTGFLIATIIYALRKIDPARVAQMFRPLYVLFRNRWWFDEWYDMAFVKPAIAFGGKVAGFDRYGIDRFADGIAARTRWISRIDEWIDHTIVDGCVNGIARMTYDLGDAFRKLQT
ncbi:MAG: NADH-quinone oxidoreductase subunit L, partial [Planctomycetia bacterium]|nr:NADH-quinone oxidoreductase subunit L [Planctomycetia bacterium]